ncbi:MAG TPA: XdhC family protein [Candidatus Dormibacteraeota bacterium]|nr:XdhC family protein [Candidatus Dormibacteraeota bacterium]
MDDDLIELLARYARAGTPCVLATVVRTQQPASARPGDKAIITADGKLRGWIGGSCAEPLVRRESLRALAEGEPRLVHIVPAPEVGQVRRRGELTVATTCPSGGALDIFVEPQLPRPLLVVFGDSPAARTLVRLGGLIGFRTCAVHPGGRIDDFPGADLVLPSLDLTPLPLGPDTWAVVATMGHYDEDALEAVLTHPQISVALVASARRAEAVRAVLRQRGLEEASLARIRAPAGGQRGGSQEEIALLALAEIARLRQRRQRGRAAPGAESSPSQATKVVEEGDFAADPVCGMAVDLRQPHERSRAGGHEHHFCSIDCRQRFEAEPGRYLQAAEAERR